MKNALKNHWRRVAGLFIVSIMLISLSACGGATKTEDTGSSSKTSAPATKGNDKKSQLTVKLSWYMPEGTPTSKQGNEIAQKIKEKSNGAITVSTYPNGSLLDESATGEGLQNNTVQMAIMGLHWWSGQAPATNFDMIPELAPSDPNQLLTKLHGKLGEDINNLLTDQGVTIAGWGFYGYVGSYINKKHKVEHPEDLKGLKMRADGDVAAEEMKQFGATPLNMSSSEVYQALQRGTIEGATSGITSFVSRKWIEAAKYMTAIKQSVFIYPIFVNSKWWDGLTDDQRKIISDAIADTEQDNIQAIKDDYDNGIKQAKQAGVNVTVIDPDSSLMSEWKEKTSFLKDYYSKNAGESGQTIIDDLASND